MNVFGTEIHTPLYQEGDDPLWYMADWRKRVASAIVDNFLKQPRDKVDSAIQRAESQRLQADIPEPFTNDIYIQGMVPYRLLVAAGHPEAPRIYPLQHVVSGWSEGRNGNPTRYRLNALLLAEDATFEEIGKLIGLPEIIVRSYEKLCWNVRDESGAKPVCRFVQLHFAYGQNLRMPTGARDEDKIKADAVRFGMAIMATRWGLKSIVADPGDPNGLFRQLQLAAQAELLHNIAAGNVDNMDLTATASQGLERERLTMEVASSTKSETEMGDLTIRLLQMMAPSLAVVIRDKAETQAMNAALESKLGAEKAIKETAVPDTGPAAAHKAINKALADHINKTQPLGVQTP